jgi:hypothetical protein
MNVEKDVADTLETLHINVEKEIADSWNDVFSTSFHDVMLDVVSTSLQHHLASWVGHALGPNLWWSSNDELFSLVLAPGYFKCVAYKKDAYLGLQMKVPTKQVFHEWQPEGMQFLHHNTDSNNLLPPPPEDNRTLNNCPRG